MTIFGFFLALATSFALLFGAHRSDARSPVGAYLATWAGVLSLNALNRNTSVGITLLTGLGILSSLGVTYASATLTLRTKRSRQHGILQQGSISPARLRNSLLFLALVGSCGALLIAIKLNDTIGLESVVTDRQLLRYEQSYGGLRSPGLASFLLSAFTIALPLAILAIRLHIAPYLSTFVLTLTIVLSVANPSRTFVFTAALWGLFAWLYADTLDSRLRRSHPVRLGLAMLLLGVVFFNWTNIQLSKQSADEGISGTYESISLYLGGGLSAFQVSMEQTTPPVDAFGRSVHAVVRLAHVGYPQVTVPDTVAKYTDISSDSRLRRTNTYSWFGDVYFDFGWSGVLIVSVLIGALGGYCYRNMRDTGSLALVLGTSLLSVTLILSFASATWLWESVLLAASESLIIGRYCSSHVRARTSRRRITLDAGRVAAEVLPYRAGR